MQAGKESIEPIRTRVFRIYIYTNIYIYIYIEREREEGTLYLWEIGVVACKKPDAADALQINRGGPFTARVTIRSNRPRGRHAAGELFTIRRRDGPRRPIHHNGGVEPDVSEVVEFGVARP
jgi:hypothetical protein